MVQLTTMMKRFDSQGEKTGWTYIEVPADLAQKLKPGNRKEFKVKGKIDKHVLSRVSLLPIGGGIFIMPVNANMRKAIGKKHGAMVKVQLTEDRSEFVFNGDLQQHRHGAARARGRGRADHALELPALCRSLEVRARAVRRVQRRLEAERAHLPDDARRRASSRSRPACPRRVQRRHAAPGERAGAPLAAHRDVDVLAFTGGPVTGKKVLKRAPSWCGRRSSSSAANRPTSCSTTPTSSRRSPAARSASSSTRARTATPAAGSSCTREDPRRVRRGARRPRAQKIRVLPPLDERSQMGALSRAPTATRSRATSSRRRRGRELRCGGPAPADGHFPRGHWYLPTVLTGVQPRPPRVPGGDLRPGGHGHEVPRRRRGHRARQRHRVRPRGRRVDERRAARAALRPGAAVRLRLDQQLQPHAGRGPLRRREVVGFRPRLRPAGDRHLPHMEDGDVVARAVRRLVQAVNGFARWTWVSRDADPASNPGRSRRSEAVVVRRLAVPGADEPLGAAVDLRNRAVRAVRERLAVALALGSHVAAAPVGVAAWVVGPLPEPPVPPPVPPPVTQSL